MSGENGMESGHHRLVMSISAYKQAHARRQLQLNPNLIVCTVRSEFAEPIVLMPPANANGIENALVPKS
jgi:hypothetical protein